MKCLLEVIIWLLYTSRKWLTVISRPEKWILRNCLGDAEYFIYGKCEKMSDCIFEYPRLLSTWEVYPRVHYFRGRFLDLLTRFKRINRAMPKTLHNEDMMTHLEEFKDHLENTFINIIVIGKEPIEDLYVCKPETTTANNEPQPPCLTVIVCHTEIDGLDEKGANMILPVIQHAERATSQYRTEVDDTFIIVCKINTPFSETEGAKFRENLHTLIHYSVHAFRNKFDIITVSETHDIKYHISLNFERRIIEAFVFIQSYLGLFVSGNTQCNRNDRNVVPIVAIRQRLRDYLCNRFALSDLDKATFLTQLVDRLARIVKCTIISPMSSKYVLPAWLCNSLLHEVQFEEGLVKSVSVNTKHFLGKLDRLYRSSKSTKVSCNQRYISSKLTSYLSSGFLVPAIQTDFTDTISKVEKVLSSMEYLTTVMRKMMFEIQGYLKQTLVHGANTLQTASALKIPDSLRLEILSIRGVYGMGTIYGQLEVHVEEQNEARIAEMMERLKTLTRKHRFLDSYTIKSIKQ